MFFLLMTIILQPIQFTDLIVGVFKFFVGKGMEGENLGVIKIMTLC